MERRIINAVTGDRIDFWSSPMMGDGEELVFAGTLAPLAAGAPVHVHGGITETFAVEYGALEIDLGGGERRLLGPGDEIVLAPGTPHGFRNPLECETRFLTTATPGMELERFLRTMYALANDGRTNAAGEPNNPLLMALTLEPMDMTMVGAPRGPQRVLVKVLANIARAVGLSVAPIRQPAFPPREGERT